MTAAVFALTHFAGGFNYVLVSFITGLGHGYIFIKRSA
ncbi:hypothetical protein [Pseudoalteromonas fuliginea]